LLLPHLAVKPEMGKKGKKGASSRQSHEVEEEEVEEVEGAEQAEDTSSSANNPVVVAQGSGGGEDTLEGILERHRRELKDMRNECQRLKKQVTQGDKKKKKDVQTEIETLESSTEQRHLREIAAFNKKHSNALLAEGVESVSLEEHEEQEDEGAVGEKRVSKAHKKKAKKEERFNELRKQAEEEAAQAPNLRLIEDEQITRACGKLNLAVKEVQLSFFHFICLPSCPDFAFMLDIPRRPLVR